MPGVTDFQAVLDKSIEDGLRHVLGESGLQMVLRLHPLPTLSTDPARFHEAMQSIFMENGAAIIEREIARRLLQNAGRERTDGRAHRPWFVVADFGARPSGRASKTEKRVLRKFVALASLPHSHLTGSISLRTRGPRGEASSIELTSLRFADAFKKGS